MRRLRDGLTHLSIGLMLGGAVTLWLLPLVRHADSAIPGEGAGDNLTFVWNLWWGRYAVYHADATFWSCPLLFHPFGVDLTLHTHTAFEAFLTALVWPAGSVVAAQNVWIVVHLLLNSVCAYALAWRAFRDRLGATVAAIAFGWSPYVSAHLSGHFNLLAAWVLPLAALTAALAVTTRARFAWPVALGATLAAAAYLDYYYAVYAAVLVTLTLLAHAATLDIAMPGRRSRARLTVIAALAGLLLIDILIIFWLWSTGGGELDVPDRTVHFRGFANPIAVAGLLVLATASVWWAPSRVSIRPNADPGNRPGRAFVIACAAAAIALSPLLWHALRVWQRGDYVTQTYFWRSAPAGIDVGTLFLGNPYNVLIGSSVQRLYASLGIDRIEQSGWIGPGILSLAAIALMLARRDRAVRLWTVCGAVFLVWALGPRLVAFGRDTHVLLPVILIRYVPIVSNARIPGRAMIVVYLALAMLCAAGISEVRRRGAGAMALAALLSTIVALDAWPVRPPLYIVERSNAYNAIEADSEPGAVLELPLGIRDGFGETGSFDSRSLLAQTFHERPLLGGFVARLPPSIREGYKSMPILAPLLRLSGGGTLRAENVDADRLVAARAL